MMNHTPVKYLMRQCFLKTGKFIGRIQIVLKSKENDMKEHGYVQKKLDGGMLMSI